MKTVTYRTMAGRTLVFRRPPADERAFLAQQFIQTGNDPAHAPVFAEALAHYLITSPNVGEVRRVRARLPVDDPARRLGVTAHWLGMQIGRDGDAYRDLVIKLAELRR